MGKSIVVIGSCVANAFIQVVLEAVHTGKILIFICFPPAAVLAGLRLIPHIISRVELFPLRIGVVKGLVMLAIGIGVGLHSALLPHTLTVYVHLCASAVAVLNKFIKLTAKSKQLRAGRSVPFCCDMIVARDVKDVLIRSHVAVVDVQRSLAAAGVHGAVVKVNRNVLSSCTVIRVNIDHFSRCIKGAGIKCHDRGAIRPNRIISTWSIEGRIDKLCTFITPVEGLAVDDAVIHHSIIRTDEAQIICITGAKRHIFEGDCFGTIKAVIAVILCAIILRVRHLSTDIPERFVSSLPHKGQVFSLGRINAADTVQCIIALAKDDGIIALGRSHSILQFRIAPLLTVDLYRMRIGCVIRKSQHGKHLKHHCHCQQGSQKPVLTFLFQLSSFLSSLFAFLQWIPRKEPSRFLPHCHLAGYP